MTYITLESLFDTYAPDIANLPDNNVLSNRQSLIDFLIEQKGPISIYYIPFELVNPNAQVMLVGITPGWTQVEIAYSIAQDGLHQGLSTMEILEQIKKGASFAGTMRANLIQMLNGIGLHEALGISSSMQLFAEKFDLMHSTSVIRFPVFIKGKNYTGSSPNITKCEMLRPYIFGRFRAEIQAVNQALIIPLGDRVTEALNLLVNDGVLSHERCLLGFPHPSGANGHRKVRYEQNRDKLRAKVSAWFNKTRQ